MPARTRGWRALAAAATLSVAAANLPATLPFANAAPGAADLVGSWREEDRFGPDDPWGVDLEVAGDGFALATYGVPADDCQQCLDNPRRLFQRRANSTSWKRYKAAGTPHETIRAHLGHGRGYAAWLHFDGDTKILERRDAAGTFRKPITVDTNYPRFAEVVSVHALPTQSIIVVRYPKVEDRLVDFQLLRRQTDGTWAALPPVGSPTTDNALPQVTELPNGALLVVWHELDQPPAFPLTGRIKAATYSGGAWSAPAVLSADRGFPDTLTRTHDGALATWVDVSGSKVHSAYFDGTTWQPQPVLDPGPDTNNVGAGTAVVARAADTVTAAWIREAATGHRAVVGASWRPGTGWTGPLRNLTGSGRGQVRKRVDSFDLTTTPRGRVTLAWSTHAKSQPVFVAHRPAGSNSWTDRERLDVGPDPVDRLTERGVAVGASKNGRVTLVTNSADGIRVLRLRP